jgi:nicotinamide-nucleotide amidase
MNCEIINVGTELLLGQNINTNALDIGRMLAAAGVDCYFQTSVGDNRARIVQAIKTAVARSDSVIITGGLGSTDDDLTRDAVADAVGRPLERDRALEKLIKDKLKQYEPAATKKALRQALLPVGAQAIKPTLGSAAGFIVETDGKLIAVTPGVPAEMRRMLETDIIPRLARGGQGPVILSRVLKVYGLREVELENMVQDIISAQTNPTIAPLIAAGGVHLRVTAKAANEAAARTLIEVAEQGLKERLGDYIYAADEADMEEVVGALLRRHHLTVATAESLTGGMIADRLINVPGSSDYFCGAIVAYDNDVKMTALGVAPQTLLSYGAVSAQTAEEMAGGVRNALGTDLGLSVTGIAGPGGGSQDKPVGLVYFCLAAPDQLLCEQHVFRGERNEIRFRASQYALNMLRLYLRRRGGAGDEPA